MVVAVVVVTRVGEPVTVESRPLMAEVEANSPLPYAYEFIADASRAPMATTTTIPIRSRAT